MQVTKQANRYTVVHGHRDVAVVRAYVTVAGVDLRAAQKKRADVYESQ
jgi:hypothetical protein